MEFKDEIGGMLYDFSALFSNFDCVKFVDQVKDDNKVAYL
jgi:hypothetical protein